MADFHGAVNSRLLKKQEAAKLARELKATGTQGCVLHSYVPWVGQPDLKELRNEFLESAFSMIFVADAESIIHGGDEDFAVTDLSSFRRFENGVNGGVEQ